MRYHALLLSLLVLLPSLYALPSASSSSSSEEYDDSSEFGADDESYESLEDGFEVRKNLADESVIQGEYDKEYKTMSICVNKNGQLVYQPDDMCKDRVALGKFRNAVNQTGWGFLEVETSNKFPPEIQAYAAGAVEGKLTRLLIYYHLENTVTHYCDGFEEFCDRLYSYLRKNLAYIRDQLVSEENVNDIYWNHVNLTMTQMTGIGDGYNNRPLTPQVSFDVSPIYFAQISGELIDLEKLLHKPKPPNEPAAGHCTGFVKVTPDRNDMFFAHVAMTGLQTMTRIVKLYKFGYDRKKVPGYAAAFSGYPATLASIDDFTLLSSGLGSTETTCAVYNTSLYSSRFMRPEGQLHCWIRSIVANSLAKSGREWSNIFARHNSGTYNNQWTVVDYKKFKKGQPLPRKDLVWVLEQYPGHVMARDVTWFVRKHGYFPSYNIPFFKKMYKLGGFDKEAEKADWFSWEKAPRSRIMRRDHHRVVNIETLTKLMRYNDYKNEPFSRCDCVPPYTAEAAMSARGDLNPKNGTYEIPGMGFRNHAGLDMKGTNLEMVKKLGLRVWGGPTYDPLPHFSWATTMVNASHKGMPTEWKFGPVDHKWSTDVRMNLH